MDDKFHLFSALQNPAAHRPRVIVDLGAAPGGWSQVAAFRTGHFFGPRYPPEEEKPFGLKNDEKPFGMKDDRPFGWNEDESWHGLENNKHENLPNVRKLPIIVALDLHRMSHIYGVTSFQADFLSPATEALIREHLPPLSRSHSVDLLLSDMAANTTGNTTVDIARSLEISEAVFQFGCRHLIRRQRSDEGMKNVSGGAMVLKYFEHPDSTHFCKTYLRPSFYSVSTFKPPSSRSESSERYWICLGFLGYRTLPDRIPDTPVNQKDLRGLDQ